MVRVFLFTPETRKPRNISKFWYVELWEWTYLDKNQRDKCSRFTVMQYNYLVLIDGVVKENFLVWLSHYVWTCHSGIKPYVKHITLWPYNIWKIKKYYKFDYEKNYCLQWGKEKMQSRFSFCQQSKIDMNVSTNHIKL